MLNVRARIEVAEADGLERSEAYTVRTRLGYGTKPFHGFSAYADFENVAPIASKQYTAPGQTPIGDPKVTELNQAFGKFAREEWLDSSVIAGRQRLVLDDARFIGDVGWRQNQQTFDGTVATSNLNVEGLSAMYGYLWDIRRVLGTEWDSSSHLLNASYRGLPEGFTVGQITGFVYLLDFRLSSPANSSATYGFRVTGRAELAPAWGLAYQGSYAYQTDYGSNPVNYEAHYGLVEAKLIHAPLGAVTLGYEHLGSDAGAIQFKTPLATAHVFNGWADVFLNNGGPMGLQDIYLSVAPKLPFKLKGKLVYHHFLTAESSSNEGQEFDALLSLPINKYFSVLTKFAYYDGKAGIGPPDTWRYWLQATLKF